MSKINIRYPEDVKIIVEAYRSHKGYDISDKEAQGLWYSYSDSVACGWCSGVSSSSPEEICNITSQYLEMKYAIIIIHKDKAFLTSHKFYNMSEASNFVSFNLEISDNYFPVILSLKISNSIPTEMLPVSQLENELLSAYFPDS